MFRASNELIASDVLAEYLVAQAIPRIANTSFAFLKNNLPLAYQEKQRITSILSNEYLDRYKITIYLFYADGRPVESTQVDDFSTAIKVIEKQSVKTNYEGVYLLQRRNAADVRHYVAVIPIKKNEKVQGLSLIHLSLARIFSDRVYPELTLDNRFARSIRNNDFSYAFYNQTSLLDQFGEMNFKQDVDSTLLRNKDIYDKGKTVNNYWVVAAEDETGRKVVVAARKASLFNLAANFSFIFVLGIILSFLFFAVSFLRRGFRHRSMDYSTRIQFLAYLFFILPLLAVSIISLRMLTQSNEAEQEKEMSDKGIHLTERLSSFLDNDSLKQKSGADNKKIKLIIASSEMDINIYDTSGKLLGTNQSSIFENQLVMPLLNRQAWENIVAQQHHSLLLKNNIGTLEYNSRYFAIYNTRHVLSGILELPFFTSSTEALKINLITNILVTFVVVFILFSFIAETAIKKITSPLRLIANRLNETKLTENKPIEWKNNDEIGMLVTEYNKMIDNLTISRNELARTQKESAWREIAQQVAHEIKNPLTPMKLTLQHLEQLMKQNSFDKIRVEKSLQTLLEQLQILNDIAGSFSSFASLPMPVITTVNLTDLMQRTVLFFQNHTLGNVFFHSSGHPLLVEADELLLSRIFSNIILNALQSRNGNGLVNVEIETTKEDKFVVVSIKDNGTGIDTALIDRIFLPHFTTKKSGSGLGLAIAKRSLEQMGGEIWFDTSARGTTFFVRVAV